MNKVLVTGANGFLASSLIRELLRCGYQVRGLLRRMGAYHGESSQELELVEGDFTDTATAVEALHGCDMVVHCAAMTAQGACWEDYLRVNVEAVRSLLLAAEDCGVKRFVLVGSANAFAYGTKDRPGDETAPTRYPFTDSKYARSKALAQRVAREYQGRMEVVTVSPTFMIGAYFPGSGSDRMVAMAKGHKFIFCPPGGKNFVDVEDVSRGIILALEKGKPGEEYLLAGENLSYDEFFRKLTSAFGQKSYIIKLPGFLLNAAGACGSIFSHFKKGCEVNLTNTRILCVGNYYTSAKSKEHLGMAYTPVTDTMDKIVTGCMISG